MKREEEERQKRLEELEKERQEQVRCIPPLEAEGGHLDGRLC